MDRHTWPDNPIEDIDMSDFKPHNPLGNAIKTVKVKGHGEVKVKSLQHLKEILLSATK